MNSIRPLISDRESTDMCCAEVCGDRYRYSLKTMVAVAAFLIASFAYSNWNSSSSVSLKEMGSPEISKAHRYPRVESLDPKFSSDVLHSIRDAKSAIYDKWDISNYPMFLTLMNIPSLSWDLQKAKFIKLLVEANANYKTGMNTAFPSLSYVAGFSGSSVTAGHGTERCAVYVLDLYLAFNLFYILLSYFWVMH
jgi:hypothetical protein